MQANADIFFEHSEWRKPLAWSAVLHVGVTTAIIVYSVFVHSRPGQGWGAGGGGGAIGVSLVSNVPLPGSSVQTKNVLANESKGLTKSLPKTVEQEPDAIPIPDKGSKKKPKPVTSASRAKIPPIEEATNEVPFGEGGPVSPAHRVLVCVDEPWDVRLVDAEEAHVAGHPIGCDDHVALTHGLGGLRHGRRIHHRLPRRAALGPAENPEIGAEFMIERRQSPDVPGLQALILIDPLRDVLRRHALIRQITDERPDVLGRVRGARDEVKPIGEHLQGR